MTLPEVCEFIEVCRNKEEDDFKTKAQLLDGLSQQLISGLNLMKPKLITLKELYPKLFAEEKKPDSDISPERKEKIAVDVWKSFLGV